jgi:SAM-dependent methyltransferase
MSQQSAILNEVADYYSAKLAEHGQSARGVDWNGEESQYLRFEQLSKVIGAEPFTVHDIGCGYGAMVDFFASRYADFSYHGYDVSADMVKAAQQKYASMKQVDFVHGSRPETPADYSVASGIFNVRLKTADDVWLSTIHETLDMMHEVSTKGFSFNCLTSYSDADKMRDYLYYADPCALFDHCKRRYSRHVALLHDYGLYEFTILVRKA